MAFDIQSVRLGNPEMDHVVNFIIILVKKYIFLKSRKDLKLCFAMLLFYFQTSFHIEMKLFSTEDF